MKKMTQAERAACYMRASMYEIMELLEWDMMLYCMFKYECGVKYLEVYLKGDMDSIDLLLRSAVYWGWWKLHWTSREREFCAMYYSFKNGAGFHPDMKRNMYKKMNNPVDLAECVIPNGVVLEESYNKHLVPGLFSKQGQ